MSSDTFYIKEGSTSPSIATTLLDPNGDPANLVGQVVTFRMYADSGASVSGAASFDSDGSDGKVFYEWGTTDLATYGGYQAEWVGTIDDTIEVFPGASYNWVEVTPAASTIISGVCSLINVRRALGRSLTDAEAVRAVSLIQALVPTLERKLNRILEPRSFTQSDRIDRWGRIYLRKNPVIEITSVSVDGVEWTGDPVDWDLVSWPYQTFVETTFTAGTDIDDGIRDTVANVIARSLQVAPVVASGAIQSYSVEGTSITYSVSGSSSGEASTGRFQVSDLKAFARLKIPVLAP